MPAASVPSNHVLGEARGSFSSVIRWQSNQLGLVVQVVIYNPMASCSQNKQGGTRSLRLHLDQRAFGAGVSVTRFIQ